jgi:predicted porin
MKKSLLAVAAIGAFASAAQAQSSVTVYGIVDAGLSATNRYISGTSTQTQSTAAGSQESSSRLGFKGSEDLGGGRSAIFTAEMGLNPAKNNFSGSTNSYNNATFDNRQMFVGINDKALGQVTFGRQYTLTHNTIVNTDTMGGNNIIGGTTYVGGNSTADFANTPTYGNSAYIVRLSETAAYESPTIMGAKALLQASTKKENAATTQKNANDTVAFGLDWTYQNARVIASRSINKVNAINLNGVDYGLAQSFGVATAYNTDGSVKTAGTVGSANVKQTETAVGATYDFGIAKVYANYLQTLLEGQFSAASTFAGATTLPQGKRNAFETGVAVPYGQFMIRAKYGMGSSNMSSATVMSVSTPSITGGSFNFRGYQAGVDYNMSKRTNLYAIYGRASGDLSATTTYSANQTAIGVRHTF